jgi:hypothetical protein
MNKPTTLERGVRLLSVACLVTTASWSAANPFVGDWKLDASKSTLNEYERKSAGSSFAGTWVGRSVEAVNYNVVLQIRPYEDGGLSDSGASRRAIIVDRALTAQSRT